MIHHFLREDEIQHLNELHQITYCHDCKSSILNGYCMKKKCIMSIDRQACEQYIGIYCQKQRDNQGRFIHNMDELEYKPIIVIKKNNVDELV